MSTAPAADLDRYIEGNLNRSIEEMKRLCAVPSVAAQGRGLGECAELVAALLRERGFEARVMEVPSAPPAVYAERRGTSDRTLLFYNHYDVQPAEPLELWETPPFEPSEREGKLFARGVADDKGHIVCRLAALDAVLASYGDLPCNVKFLIEGGEEISSPGIPEFVSRHRDLLAADACIWESGGVDYDDRPDITLGMRGICYVELRVRTASRDAHSGFGGSIMPNAAWRLVWALNAIKGTDGRIRVPGHYDSVREPSAKDVELLEALPDQEQQIKETYGISEFLHGLTGLELRRAAVFEPTCTICGLSSGYEGDGPKTVLPAYAMAKVDFRLVPDQTPEGVVENLRRYLEREGFGDVEVTFLGGERPAKVDPDDPFVQMTIRTAREVYGQEPVVRPIVGGSGPMYPFVVDLGLPVSNTGIGYPHARAHAPNEHVRLSDFVLGTRHTARVISEFASTRSAR